MQLDLFAHVAEAYAAAGGALDNETLYRSVARRAGLDEGALHETRPIGRAASPRSPIKRRIRWYQQTLKTLGVLRRVPGQRGLWELTESARDGLMRARRGVRLLAFSTDLGLAIWARNEDVFPHLGEPIALCVTSPPYPLRRPRAYGNPDSAEYTDFITQALEPVVRSLLPGGSIVLNLSNGIFEPGLPSRSLYLERLTLALHERLGLHLMDRIPWVNRSKPPGPTMWACIRRVQLTEAYEPVLWFTNDPMRVRADNRRVLQAHTERHAQLIAAGGERRTAAYGDGAYRLAPGDFGAPTAGRIPRNVIERGHQCADTRAYRRYAKEQGLPIHGAMFPTDLPAFFIQLLTEPDELVVDLFGGTARSGLASERLGRRWLVTEWIWQFLHGARSLFEHFPGYRAG